MLGRAAHAPALAGLGAGYGTAWATTDLVARLHQGGGGIALNGAKGVLGEAMMDRIVGQGLLHQTGWSPASAFGHPNGIDGLFFRVGGRGELRDLLVMEAKTYTSPLGHPQIGPQMGSAWINHHLQDIGTRYAEWAERFPGALQVRDTPPRGAVQIPLGDRRSAWIWQQDGQTLYATSDHRQVHPQRVQRQLEDIARWLEHAAAGDVDHRARIFRYDVLDGQHRIRIFPLDPATHELGPAQEILGAFEDLPAPLRRVLRQSFEDMLRYLGKEGDELAALVDRACADPDFAASMRARAQWHRHLVTAFEVARVGLIAALAAATSDLLAQWWFTGRVDWRRVLWRGALYGAGASVGVFAGAHLAGSLLGTELGRAILGYLPGQGIHALWARSLGSAGGGLVTVAFIIGVQLALGQLDRETAARSLLAGGSGTLAGLGASGGMMWAATTFGTASTGTAISSLSGAAATNAGLAWLGGGAVSAGGWGMAGGAVVVGGVGAVAVIGMTATVGMLWKGVDERRERRLVLGRLGVVEESVMGREVSISS